MSNQLPAEPFGSEEVPDYVLSEAPLVRALVQIRFPSSTELLSDPNAILLVAKTLADDYPVFEEEQESELVFGPNGMTAAPRPMPRWQLTSFSEKDTVVITPTSIAFETRTYVSRADTLAKLESIFDAALPVIKPALMERVGVRFTNLVTDDAVSQVHSLFKSELLAGLALGDRTVPVLQSITHTLFQLDDHESLGVRWGILPPGGVIDAGIPAQSGRAFIFDLDAFRNDRVRQLNAARINDHVSVLAERAYRFFLWSLTEDGIAHFGGREK